MTVTTVLVTGGHGFLGSHVAKRLYDQGDDFFVKVIDIAPSPPPSIPRPLYHKFINGNICDFATCTAAIQGVSWILHFAANMGGMGTIHEQNDLAIYEQNHIMIQNLLKAASLPGSSVSKFFFASSACVYPESLQNDKDISLRESDVFIQDGTLIQVKPQGLYGLEKLNAELLLNQFVGKFEIRIARFHNIYGPGGSWNNGREKAPAALLRKALVCRRMMDRFQRSLDYEVWGDGTQRRSFLFIKDAVDAIMKLLSNECSTSAGRPIVVNIGSDYAVSIQKLAEISLQCANTSPSFKYEISKPVGVSSRNSNNELSSVMLDWAPTTSLEEGMAQTCEWIHIQLDSYLAPYEQHAGGLDESLRALSASKLVDIEGERLTFAILLPITSRGSTNENDCLENLRHFAQTLKDTTWRDTHHSSDQCFRYVIYLAIDPDDTFLLIENNAETALVASGIPVCQIHQIIMDHPKGHVCAIWRDCARVAYQKGCDYFVLMGDDISLKDEGWMRITHSTFNSLAASSGLPFGLGCVAFTDVSFPGMPTFPIIHRTHMDVFNGEIVPDIFKNQDGDPYLFQLYRRWGTSVMLSCRLENTIGGPVQARYVKHHTSNWSLTPLAHADQAIGSYLQNCHGYDKSGVSSARKLTLDIIIPCYRVDLTVLSTILSLESPPSCSVNFIIIVDCPDSPYLPALLAKHSHSPHIRIRVNDHNLGAPFSRNRGLAESSAEWVHFLDDDVIPSSDLLFAVSDAIKANPLAAGFVCNTRFPQADSVFTTAVHLSGVTFFWDIATKWGRDVPWGVTANLVARRVLVSLNVTPNLEIPHPTKFSLIYPKTGGGEDIDYCLSQRTAHLSVYDQIPISQEKYPGFLPAPNAIVTHPWWNNGRRSYWRFYNWSIGDGHLINEYPNLSYQDYAPNSAECLVFCALTFFTGVISISPKLVTFSVKMTLSIVAANVIHDFYRHTIPHPERNAPLDVAPHIRQSYRLWTAAILESSLIRMFSELGRLRGIVVKREWRSIGKRFDWFVGRIPGDIPRKEERRTSVERVVLALVLYMAMIRSKY